MHSLHASRLQLSEKAIQDLSQNKAAVPFSGKFLQPAPSLWLEPESKQPGTVLLLQFTLMVLIHSPNEQNGTFPRTTVNQLPSFLCFP